MPVVKIFAFLEIAKTISLQDGYLNIESVTGCVTDSWYCCIENGKILREAFNGWKNETWRNTARGRIN
jgi:hypothetical protein